MACSPVAAYPAGSQSLRVGALRRFQPNCISPRSPLVLSLSLSPLSQHVFNESYNLPASAGMAGIVHLDPNRHVSYIVQSG